MIADLFLLLVVGAGLVALAQPRLGIYLLLVVGCIQDPIRKLMPGTPAIMAISALPVWLGMCVGMLRNDALVWPRFERAYPRLARSLRILLLCLVPPILVVFGYGLQAWSLAALGTFAYVAPIATLVVAFSFARTPADVRRLLTFYAVFASLMLTGTFFEYAGWASPALGTSALGTAWIRYPSGGGAAFALISGFFRSPDIMGWHAAMLVMATLALAFSSRRARDRVWLLATIWGLFCVFVAGRRKMMLMPAVWLGFMLVAYVRAGRLRALGPLMVALALGIGGFSFVTSEGVIRGDYYAYAATTLADAPERLGTGTFQALWVTLMQSGILGRGIGSATQGAQHIQGGPGQSWQESGASKLLVELGLPGFVCALLVAFGLMRAARAVLARVELRSAGGALVVSAFGILAAGAVSFLVSHQVYGDLLTATFSAFLLGVALSGPRWAKSGTGTPRAAPSPWAAARPQPPAVPEASA